MCLNPIRKQSNRKYFLPGRWQSYYNEYPCGECVECKRNRELDDYIRTLWECKYVFNVCNGYAIFDTLTYDNKNLPHISDIVSDFGIKLRYDIPEFLNLSCFRLSDWRSFMTNLNAKLVYQIKKQIQYWMKHYFKKDLTIRDLHKTWRVWFKKLYGFDCPKHIYNYMMASEFGHDYEYIDDSGNQRKGTRRPHYHVIFFSYLPEKIITPENFSRAVHDAWNRGRTDGCDWHNLKSHRNYREWREKRVFSDIKDNTLNVNVLNVLSYIAKYVHKDVDFRDKFEPLEDRIYNCIYPQYEYDNFWKLLSGDYEKYKEWKRFKRNLYNFSKKGHDFGIYYVDWLNSEEGQKERDEIIDRGYIVLPLNQNQKVYRHSIPSYYCNKLFKESYYNKDGKKRWRPNSLGLSVKKKQILLSIHNMVRKYREFLMNASHYITLEDMSKLNGVLNKQRDDEALNKFLYFVARWYRLYEGRLMDKFVKRVDFNTIDISSLPTWDEMIDIIVDNLIIDADDDMRTEILSSIGDKLTYGGEPIIFNYQANSSIAHFGRGFITDRNLGNDEFGYSVSRQLGWQMNDDRYFPFIPKGADDFKVENCELYGFIHALSAKQVKGLEDVVLFKQLFDKYRDKLNEDKQDTEDFKDALVKRYESLGIKCKNKNKK